MSQSGLQVLLHAGELEYILSTIKASKKTRFVGGCLFGLWRNSLKQPVIQFVTGPGKKFDQGDSIEKLFENEHIKTCAKVLKVDHCLLHLGFWFYGSEDDQAKAERIVFKQWNKYNVLLFVNLTGPTDERVLSGEYILKKEGVQATSSLFQEDVLDGHSSFRLYEPLTSKLQDKVPPPFANEHSRISVSNLINSLPSRLQVEEAVTRQEQWYSSEEGMQRLQLLFQYFNEADIEVGMSRDANTHNFQFDINGGYSLDFPVNFPQNMPIFRTPDGKFFEIPREPSERDVCKTVVTVVRNYLQYQSSGSGRRGGNRR